MEYLMAFLIGGAFCAVAQVVLDVSKQNPALIMVVFVVLGAVLSGFGVYEPLIKLGGAGASIPLPAFGHAMVQGIFEDLKTKGFMGLFTGGLKAASMGLTSAIFFGYVISLLFNPKG